MKNRISGQNHKDTNSQTTRMFNKNIRNQITAKKVPQATGKKSEK
jgi:hypothetical protein